MVHKLLRATYTDVDLYIPIKSRKSAVHGTHLIGRSRTLRRLWLILIEVLVNHLDLDCIYYPPSCTEVLSVK